MIDTSYLYLYVNVASTIMNILSKVMKAMKTWDELIKMHLVFCRPPSTFALNEGLGLRIKPIIEKIAELCRAYIKPQNSTLH